MKSLREIPDYYECSRPEVQALVNPASRTILDVGCASGTLGAQVKEALGAEVWGVEIVEDIARQAEERLDRVLTGSIEDVLPLLPDQYFDTVIFADVLEHLADPYSVVKRIKSKLSRNGEIVASIPNVRHWSVVKDLLEGRWDYQDAGILDRTHLRFFTRKSVIELFLDAGYSITEMQATALEGVYISKEILKALAPANLDISTLEEESGHYQYLVRTQVAPTWDAFLSELATKEARPTTSCS